MTYKPKSTHERILHRLKISLGHLKKVVAMAESHKYCLDVIHQSQAVQKALRQTEELILENHLKTCVAKAIRQGKDQEAIKEVMAVIAKRN